MPGVTVRVNTRPPALSLASTTSKPSSSKPLPVPPLSPGTHSAYPAMQNGFVPSLSIQDIKQNAIEQVDREVKGYSALSLIRNVKTHLNVGREYEAAGKLPHALASYTKAARLLQITMVSDEVRNERHGVVNKELDGFVNHSGQELQDRIRSVQDRIKEGEDVGPLPSECRPAASAPTTPNTRPGGSIADRVRLLQESAGTSLATTGRIAVSRPRLPDLPSAPTTPPGRPLPPKPPLAKLDSSLPLSIPSSPHPQHTFVAPSSLGPPSPASSPASSPQLSSVNISEFAQAFPSIDELDAQAVQPVPTGSSVRSVRSNRSLNQALTALPSSASTVATATPPIPITPLSPTFITNYPQSPSKPGPPVPAAAPEGNANGSASPHRPFSLSLGMNLDRPSSTPITPSANAFESRTPSPTLKHSTSKRPLRPSGLSTAGTSQQQQHLGDERDASSPDSTRRTTPDPDLPMSNMVLPRDLVAYMTSGKKSVLFVDVRTRPEFEKEHVRAEAIVCVEPSVLARDRVTSDTVEDSFLIAPKNEHALFSNRDKFDLVAIYDTSSTSPSSSTSYHSSTGASVPAYVSPSVAALHGPSGSGSNPAIGALVMAIYEQAFKKMLKRMPMMIVGGLEGWKKELGEGGVVRGGEEDVVSPLAQQHSTTTSHTVSLVQPIQPTQLQSPPPPVPQPPVVPRARADTDAISTASKSQSPLVGGEHRSHMSLDRSAAGHTRAPAESNSNTSYMNGLISPPPPPLSTSTIRRPPPAPAPSPSRAPSINTRTSSVDYYGSTSSTSTTLPSVNGVRSGAISYPSFAPRLQSSTSTSQIHPPSSPYSSSSPPISTLPTSLSFPYDTIVTPPPLASLPTSIQRRNSRGVDLPTSNNNNNAASSSSSSLRSQTIIEYPQISLRMPPPVASVMHVERQDNRPRQTAYAPPGHPSVSTVLNGALALSGAPKPPRIASDYPVTYWPDTQIATSGLKNLGNTCYMNATIQCLSATVPFTRFFTDGRWKTAVNYTNPLGTKGEVARAFAKILHEMWHGELPYITPFEFRKSMGQQKIQYGSSDQQDSQEFLSFLLDGVHEDLNRVMAKPTFTRSPEQEAELEVLLPQIASEQEWQMWQTRNDSIIVDFFQGQFRNRLRCLTCGQTSTTYNAFSLLQLPIPSTRSSKVPLQKCFEAYCNTEIMEKDDAWDCPKCKAKRQATKELSLSRLPPVLIIHLKRFENNGRFSDKIDTFVDFPLKSLDLTGFMPGPLPSGADKGRMVMSPEDPRTQIPPYRYDLYGVTNHYGNLSSGHYTAFISSRGGWMYCDDSSVKPADAKQVVNQKAYVLFYKRSKTN